MSSYFDIDDAVLDNLIGNLDLEEDISESDEEV